MMILGTGQFEFVYLRLPRWYQPRNCFSHFYAGSGYSSTDGCLGAKPVCRCHGRTIASRRKFHPRVCGKYRRDTNTQQYTSGEWNHLLRKPNGQWRRIPNKVGCGCDVNQSPFRLAGINKYSCIRVQQCEFHCIFFESCRKRYGLQLEQSGGAKHDQSAYNFVSHSCGNDLHDCQCFCVEQLWTNPNGYGNCSYSCGLCPTRFCHCL